MQSFAEIHALACERHGGAAALEAELATPLPREALAAIPDDRWLAGFSRVVFQAGMSWKVVDAKWPGIEAAFDGFDVSRNALRSDDELDALAKDTRVIRSPPKIASVRTNAAMLGEFAREHGSAARMFAGWPPADYVGLLGLLRSRGSRLGGNSSAYALRQMGYDGFVFSRDGVAALVRAGVVPKEPKTAREMAAVQAALNAWMEESGRPLTQISQILARSIDAAA